MVPEPVNLYILYPPDVVTVTVPDVDAVATVANVRITAMPDPPLPPEA